MQSFHRWLSSIKPSRGREDRTDPTPSDRSDHTLSDRTNHTPSNTTPLCPTCNRLLLSIHNYVHNVYRSSQELQYHPTSPALVKSAERCPLCAAFCQIRPQKNYSYADPMNAPYPEMG